MKTWSSGEPSLPRRPAEIVAALRSAGCDVAWTLEDSSGAPDDAVIARAANEQRVLITEDKDLGDLVYRSGRASSGVCLLRLTGLSASAREDRMTALIAKHGARLTKCFTVIEPHRFRFRPLVAMLQLGA